LQSYKVVLLIIGLVLIGAAWLPHLLRQRILSFPIVYVVLGFVLYQLPLPLPTPDPIRYSFLTERLTELVILIALTGAGLRIDTPIGWRRWNTTWRLLGIAMPLCIIAGAWLGYALAGLPLTAALLLGAILAPTDPVLAADVQVGPPGSGGEDPVRFSLTSEAGLNDGLAFPFTHLALAIALAANTPAGAGSFDWLTHWFWIDFLYRIAAGIGIGFIAGYFLMRLIFRAPTEVNIADSGEGLAALAITLFVYGLTEIIGGYGFLAVFVAALAMRHYERDHEYHETLNLFAEQCERLLMTLLLLLFGGALAYGLLDHLNWAGVCFGLLFILVVRPLTGLLALLRSVVPWRERLAISAFGVRGIGSFYYLAYALNHADWPQSDMLWAMVGFVVLLSVLVHGLSGTPVMQLLDSRRRQLARSSQAAGGAGS